MQTQVNSIRNFLGNACWTVLKSLLVIIALSVSVRSTRAGNESREIEVSDGHQTFRGMVVAKSAEDCFILDRFGRQFQVPISDLKSFEVISDNFRVASPNEFRRMLEIEMGPAYEVAASKHYIVCGVRGRSRNYAIMFENIYHQIDLFYSIRGFRTSKPETPLVAVVLPDQAEFKKYCERDRVSWKEGLKGYYLRSSNRVAMYDTPKRPETARMMPGAKLPFREPTLNASRELSGLRSHPFGASFTRLRGVELAPTVSGETADTIIHETTHQVGFNIGIHSRVGDTPTWTLEGLATVLESPGMRSQSGSGSSADRLNSERLEWFRREYALRRQPGDLSKLIASDDMFRTQVMDAYSAAWGLTWFLTENPARARMFSKYLRTVSNRDPVQPYTPEERLEDFQFVFGDISRLEVEYVRAMDRL